MDPTLFHINWDVLAELMMTIIVLSFFVERSLSILFEHKVYIDNLKGKGLKEPIAFALSLGVISFVGFDAISILFSKEENSAIGYFITAAIIAGGSKASIALFHDLLKAKSTAQIAASQPKP